MAGSTIAVAGTIFSITIATLTLASNQLGPRLLSSFTSDRGNQVTLGVYLGTFVYALTVLRSVRGVEQGAFIPHLAISFAILLALLCVGMLIYFVHHVADRINFDTVIHLVARDMLAMLERHTEENAQPAPPPSHSWEGGCAVAETRTGYIQQMDEKRLAGWAVEQGCAIRLTARVGDFVFPGAPLAIVNPPVDGAGVVLRDALVIGPYPTASGDIEFAVGQLVDVADRALSRGVNDPRTAQRVLNQLGAALCRLSGRHLRNGVVACDGRIVLYRNATDYAGLCDAMFHTIRQSGFDSAPVMIHMLEVLRKIAICENDPARLAHIRRHGEMVREDALQGLRNPADKRDLEERANALFRTIAEKTGT